MMDIEVYKQKYGKKWLQRWNSDKNSDVYIKIAVHDVNRTGGTMIIINPALNSSPTTINIKFLVYTSVVLILTTSIIRYLLNMVMKMVY